MAQRHSSVIDPEFTWADDPETGLTNVSVIANIEGWGRTSPIDYDVWIAAAHRKRAENQAEAAEILARSVSSLRRFSALALAAMVADAAQGRRNHEREADRRRQTDNAEAVAVHEAWQAETYALASSEPGALRSIEDFEGWPGDIEQAKIDAKREPGIWAAFPGALSGTLARTGAVRWSEPGDGTFTLSDPDGFLLATFTNQAPAAVMAFLDAAVGIGPAGRIEAVLGVSARALEQANVLEAVACGAADAVTAAGNRGAALAWRKASDRILEALQ